MGGHSEAVWDPGWRELGGGGTLGALEDLGRWGRTAGFERELEQPGGGVGRGFDSHRIQR